MTDNTDDGLLTVQLIIGADSEAPLPIGVVSATEVGDDKLEVELEDGGLEEYKRELGIDSP